MRILFISKYPPVRELGAPKVLVELSDAMRDFGHQVTLAGQGSGGFDYREFDVVEFDHEQLPADLPIDLSNTLLVARSVLLVHHLDHLEIPAPKKARATLGKILHGPARIAARRARIAHADVAIARADLINVSNDRDRDELVQRNVSEAKIVVLPFGIDANRRRLFDALPLDRMRSSKIAFVGTFDYRKGALDLPRIFESIVAQIAGAELHLFGTAGLMQTTDEVLEFLPSKLRDRVHVVTKFKADELPALLADCSVGVFPSYYEGFGFGVLEMLAAAIPVVAYDVPGPPMMLPQDRLLAPGDVDAMARKLVALLRLDPAAMQRERQLARDASQKFSWPDIARATIDTYSRQLSMKRNR